MGITVGFNSGGTINFNTQPVTIAETSGTLSAQASAEDSAAATQGMNKPVAGAQVKAGQGASDAQSSGDIAVDTLLKRMKELQELLQKQQQQLAAAQSASYPSPEAKVSAVTGIQALIATTNSALLQVAAALAKALSSSSTSGSMVSTTA